MYFVEFEFEGHRITIYNDNSIHIGGLGFSLPICYRNGKIEWNFSDQENGFQSNILKNKNNLIEEIERRLKLLAFT